MSSLSSIYLIKLASLSLTFRFLTILILIYLPRSGWLPCFDCSAQEKYQKYQGLVRWDTLHFIKMASHGGRLVEQDWAFGNGIVWILQLGDWIGRSIFDDQATVICTSLLAISASVGSTVLLSLLTFELTKSIKFTSLVGLLHIFSPSPSTQVVPYTEPFYAFFSFLASYRYARLSNPSSSKRFHAKLTIAIFAAIATTLRSIGIIQASFWISDWLDNSKKLTSNKFKNPKKRLFDMIINSIQTFILVLITSGPFLLDQYLGYREFCMVEFQLVRPWCSNLIPSIYNFVQSHYWDVGFLRYWTVSQSPLFLLSAPVYWVSIASIFY
ncbi:hypothetical protein O181_058439 [Austropuccinia psidii MF-1]|uniref:GPI mannosyltransferase 2 n=1 Tax=Austropuccinia psidii MF-1 TaxID=1389203 RepID=A0A9Q3HXM8_9BASI|nr:hypothetical protein [Austropuccinia psidii MF-1]